MTQNIKNNNQHIPNSKQIPPISLKVTPRQNKFFSENNDTSDFQYVPSHKRSNSDLRPEMSQYLKNSTWPESFDSNLEFLLPSSVIEEINIVEQPQLQPSIERFETILSEKGADEAKRYFNEILSKETDDKEKGKLFRSAAEISKRLSEISLSIELYLAASNIDPTTPASWIDRAKLLDELGEYIQAEKVLLEGTIKVSHSEQIVRKLLKSYERTNNLEAARKFLSLSFQNNQFENDFILVEGSLFELRQGNVELAWKILKDVKKRGNWKPNVFSELVLYLEKTGNTFNEFEIVEEGAKLNPRNAIVCQAYLRHQIDPITSIELLKDLSTKWTAEFKDKMTSVVCENLAECGEIGIMRNLLAESLSLCSSKQRYKLLLVASILELLYGNQSICPLLLDLTLKITPYKSKPLVSILLAKVFELDDNYDHAEKIFKDIINEFAAEWRVFLEFAQFYVHRNNISAAIEVLNNALKLHQGSGRIWAFRVQLESFISVESQINVLKSSIQSVPKSGEVWCEAARIVLNPLTEYFNTESARQYLDFAYRFTPQHGDTLIELLRVELLEKGFGTDLSLIRQKFISSEGNYGQLFLFIKHLNERSMNDVFDDAVKEVKEDLKLHSKLYSRAIARSSFVVKSIFEEEEKIKNSKKEKDISTFTFGLSKVGKFMLNPSLCNNKDEFMSIVVGTSACSQ